MTNKEIHIRAIERENREAHLRIFVVALLELARQLLAEEAATDAQQEAS